MEARVSYVTLLRFCYQTTRLINPDGSQLCFNSSFAPLGILPCLSFFSPIFFTLSFCSLFDISLFFCFLRAGLLFGTAFIFFPPGVCNTSTTWQSHSIFTDTSLNTTFQVTKITSPSHIVKDLRFYY